MSVYKLKTFADIVRMVREELHITSTDTNAITRIKGDINLVYQELCAEKNWWWLEANASLQIPAYISAGTVAVTQGSAAITFSSAPAASQRGRLFFTNDFSEIYTIESHTAGATAAKLNELYAGSTAATASYKLFTDRFPLPTDCKETTNIWHDFSSTPIEGRGRQDFRKLSLMSPKREGKPEYYYTGDFVDPAITSAITSLPATLTRASVGVVKTVVFASALPSAFVTEITDGEAVRINISGASQPTYNGNVIISGVSTTTVTNDTITYTGKADYYETAASDTTFTIVRINQEDDYDRHRELYLYPSLNDTRVTIHVDYVKETFPLEDDDDEPEIPVQDRSILVYGALYRGYAKTGKTDAATLNLQLYSGRLKKMESKLTDSFDTPKLQPSKLYMGSKRAGSGRRASMGDSSFSVESGGSGSGSVATGTADRAAQFGSDGILTASSTVSTTELGYLDGVTSAVQTQLDAITTLADGKIYIGNASNAATEVTPSGDVTMTNTGVNAIAAGVIVDADISASAAITRSKTASGTAYRILANNSSGVMAENAALTASSAIVSDSNGQLVASAFLPVAPQTVAMSDNQAAAANVVTWTVATYDNIHMKYSIKRGAAIIESGSIDIASDGTNASIAVTGTTVGTSGVTLTADVSAGSLRLRYTSTSTGTAPSFKYSETKWLG